MSNHSKRVEQIRLARGGCGFSACRQTKDDLLAAYDAQAKKLYACEAVLRNVAKLYPEWKDAALGAIGEE